VTFESGSKLSVIEKEAFLSCSSLQSIFITSSVQILCEGCFCCDDLSIVTFEAGSQLSAIGPLVFSDLSSFSWFCVPSQIEEIGGGTLRHLKNRFEAVNDTFIVGCGFLLNLREKSIIRFFVEQEEVDLVAVIGELGTDMRVVRKYKHFMTKRGG
jgi:hypothetical protein